MRHIQALNHYALQQSMLQGMALGMSASAGMCGAGVGIRPNAMTSWFDPVGGPAQRG